MFFNLISKRLTVLAVDIFLFLLTFMWVNSRSWFFSLWKTATSWLADWLRIDLLSARLTSSMLFQSSGFCLCQFSPHVFQVWTRRGPSFLLPTSSFLLQLLLCAATFRAVLGYRHVIRSVRQWITVTWCPAPVNRRAKTVNFLVSTSWDRRVRLLDDLSVVFRSGE